MSEPTPDHLQGLLGWIRHTAEHELDCDELLDHLAAYAEALPMREGAYIPLELGKVAQHLAVCPECDEECQALLLALDEAPRSD